MVVGWGVGRTKPRTERCGRDAVYPAVTEPHYTFLLTRAVQDAARRLRPVCADWPEEQFANLVQDAALKRLKYQTSPAVFESLRNELDGCRDTLLLQIRERAD